jgi:hypothetical protein
MVPSGNALGVLSRKFHIPPLKINGIKKRCNAVDGTFYDAINVYCPPINRPTARSTGVAILMITFFPIYGISPGMSLAYLATPFNVGIARIMDKKARKASIGSVPVIYPRTIVI